MWGCKGKHLIYINKEKEKDMKLRILAMVFATAFLSAGARAQVFGIKTNVASDAFTNLNLGIEAGLAPKWTLDIEGEINAWHAWNDKQWKHWLIQPEARYWFCDRFMRHFIGVHAHGGKYNMTGYDGVWNFLHWPHHSLKDQRYQGWFAGVGVSYGYAWPLGKHWNFETEIGIGYTYTKFDRFGKDECTGCENQQLNTEGKDHQHYLGPTRVAINLVYLF